MKRLVLPISHDAGISSYVQHAYINAIINNDDLMKLYIKDLNKDWIFDTKEVKYELDTGMDTITLHDSSIRKSTKSTMVRKSLEYDEIVVKLQSVKIQDPLSYIQVSFKQSKNQVKEEPLYFIKWNQYNVNIDEELLSRDEPQFAFYKLVKRQNRIEAYISYDNMHFSLIKETEMKCALHEQLNIEIELFYGNNQYLPWKYMNYIQLFYKPQDWNTVYLDYFMFPRKGWDASYNYACNFLDTEYDSLKYNQGLYPSVKEYMKSNLHNGVYLNLPMDEYYLVGSKNYNRKHNFHYNLVYGYDDIEEVFYFVGYKKLGKLSWFTLPYSSCEDSIFGENVVKYRYNVNTIELKFDIDVVIQMLQDYLTGADSSKRMGNLLSQEDGCYGLNVFKEIGTTERGRELLFSDNRLTYVLFEHCSIMKERLKYMIEEGYIDTNVENQLLEQCNSMVNAAEKLKNVVIKNSFVYTYCDKIIQYLDELYEIEKEFYTNLLHHICK